MRSTRVMLAVLALSGCGQADGVEAGRTRGTLAVEATRVKEVAFPLRGESPGLVSKRVRSSLALGAERLSDLQADRIGDNAHNGLTDDDPDDGGWDFTLAATATSHSPTPSPENTYGATALGPWAALRAGADTPRTRTTLLGAGLGSQERPEVDSPNDFVFLPVLAEVTTDTGFNDLARSRYDAKVAAAGGAQALAERTRDARHAAGNDGLILYDLAWFMFGAISLNMAFPGVGYDADANVYSGVAVSDITSSTPFFNVDDANERFYYQGLAWSLVVLSQNGTAPGLLTHVRDLLRGAQGADGAWGFNAASPADDLQSTTHVVQALAVTSGDSPEGQAEARQGASWILSQQAANGGWEYTPGQESTLVDAEAMLALYLAQLFASPASSPNTSGIGQSAQALTTGSGAEGNAAIAAPVD